MQTQNTRRGFTQIVKNDGVICPTCGEQSLAPEGFNPGGAVATKEGQNRNKTSWPLLPRLAAVLPPQGREMRRGFTLMELLVVILIIGILAAVALPQYQVTALKARTVKYIPLLNAMEMAQNAYYLEHGSYASNRNDLDLQANPNIVWGYGSNFAVYGKAEVQKGTLQLQWNWRKSPPWDHKCIPFTPVATQVCQLLGGEEAEERGVGKHYKLP